MGGGDLVKGNERDVEGREGELEEGGRESGRWGGRRSFQGE